MQKTTYNNHYYFLILICFIMLFLPANAYASIDAKSSKVRSLVMPQWCSWVLILQVSILYFYATVAKLYPDWLDGTATKLIYSGKTNFPVIGKYFTEKWFYLPIAYLGILFDGLVVPLFLWRRTRTIALIASLIFHLANSFILQVGIFPYFALSFIVFFYPAETIRNLFFKKRPVVSPKKYSYQSQSILYYIFIPYFIIQILLPIRHWFIKGDVFWTEEGHKLSWRMMLRSKSGYTNFRIVDKSNGNHLIFNIDASLKENKPLFNKDTGVITVPLTYKQHAKFNTHPDIIWQTAQYIKNTCKQQGIDVAIYADSFVSVNGHPTKRLIDNNVDLAEAKWNYFSHNNWLLLYDDYRK